MPHVRLLILFLKLNLPEQPLSSSPLGHSGIPLHLPLLARQKLLGHLNWLLEQVAAKNIKAVYKPFSVCIYKESTIIKNYMVKW